MKIELLLNSAPIKQTYWKGWGEASGGRELYIGGEKMDLESDLKKVSLINRNKFAGPEQARGNSQDLSVSATQTLESFETKSLFFTENYK